MSSQIVYIEPLENNISIIWFDNPPISAISIEFLNQLNLNIEKIKNDRNIRCLLIGSKTKHFCAGADLKERSSFTNSQTIEFLTNINNTFNEIEDLNIPVIAMLNGATLGGGAELSLCADFRISDSTLKIGFPETSLGIIPGAGGTYRLPRILGIQKAKKLIYSAEILNSKTAFDLNLIDNVSDNIIDDTIEFANTIIKNSPIGISSAKSSINNNFNLDRSSGLKIENEAYSITLGTKDRQEALKAFKEKRKPIWQNK